MNRARRSATGLRRLHRGRPGASVRMQRPILANARAPTVDPTASPMNSIFIHDLRLQTRIGVYEWEQHLAQTLRLDLEIGLSSDAAFRSDDLADALDYSAVVKRLSVLAAEHPHRLMERFAQAVADIVLGEYPASWVKVRVAKLAPIAGVKELGVAIERHRR